MSCENIQIHIISAFFRIASGNTQEFPVRETPNGPRLKIGTKDHYVEVYSQPKDSDLFARWVLINNGLGVRNQSFEPLTNLVVTNFQNLMKLTEISDEKVRIKISGTGVAIVSIEEARASIHFNGIQKRFKQIMGTASAKGN